jgi:hypothetical protein
VPLPPPASLKDLGIPDASLGGALGNHWYLLLLPGTALVGVMAVPLVAPETSLLGFAIPIALTLLGAAAWLVTQQRASAMIAKRLVDTPGPDARRVIGVVDNDGPVLVRETFWFVITGVHHGTEQVQNVHGGYDTVATQTPTSNSYGYRQEQREPLLRLTFDGEPWIVETHTATSWAAPIEPLRAAPALQQRGGSLGSNSMGVAFVRSARAWERETIARGHRVVAVGRADPAARRLGSGPAVFGVAGDLDPLAVLRAELLHRRWPIAALIVLAGFAIVAALAL